MVRSPNEWKILKRDVKPQTNISSYQSIIQSELQLLLEPRVNIDYLIMIYSKLTAAIHIFYMFFVLAISNREISDITKVACMTLVRALKISRLYYATTYDCNTSVDFSTLSSYWQANTWLIGLCFTPYRHYFSHITAAAFNTRTFIIL